MRYELWVVLPEKLSLNKYHYYHYHKLHNIKQRFYEEVAYSEKTGYLPKPPYKCDYHFYIWGARMDITNLFGMVKPLEDGLVRNGIIEDDNPNIVAEITVRQEQAPESSKKTKLSYCRITITPYGKQETEAHC